MTIVLKPGSGLDRPRAGIGMGLRKNKRCQKLGCPGKTRFQPVAYLFF